MVQVGTIEYKAKVVGADEAQAKTDSLSDSYAEMGEQAETTAASAGFLGGQLSSTADETEQAGEEAREADTQFTLLKGTLGGVAGRLAGLGGIGGGGGLAGLLGGVGLGTLVSKLPSVASLLKGAAGLGALVIAADTIGDIIDGKDPITAFVTSAEDFGEFILNPLGIENDLVEGVAGIGTFILGTMSIASFITGVSISTMITGAGAAIASFLGVSSLSGLVTGAGATIATFLGGVSLSALVISAGSIAALIGGVASLGDLVDGNISSWNLPGKFGAALGEGFREAWPDMADSIHTAFTQNPIADAGAAVGGAPGQAERDIASFLDPRQEWQWTGLSGGAEPGDPGRASRLPGGATGGIVMETGAATIHKGEAIIPEPIVTAAKGGGKGGETTVTNVDNITVELSGEFDPSNVSRRDLDSLADRLVDLIGDKTNRRAGVR